MSLSNPPKDQSKEDSTLQGKYILDACCGGRRFWFNKRHPNTLYVDIRPKQKVVWGKKHYRELLIDPDIVMDFRKLDLPDNHFSLVVFDPPHLVDMPETSMFTKTYGSLDGDWRQDITKGFSECFRVLKPNGVLIFKWATAHIPLKDILALTDEQPLFGHPTGRKHSDTHWVTFMKHDSKRLK